MIRPFSGVYQGFELDVVGAQDAALMGVPPDNRHAVTGWLTSLSSSMPRRSLPGLPTPAEVRAGLTPGVVDDTLRRCSPIVHSWSVDIPAPEPPSDVLADHASAADALSLVFVGSETLYRMRAVFDMRDKENEIARFRYGYSVPGHCPMSTAMTDWDAVMRDLADLSLGLIGHAEARLVSLAMGRVPVGTECNLASRVTQVGATMSSMAPDEACAGRAADLMRRMRTVMSIWHAVADESGAMRECSPKYVLALMSEADESSLRDVMRSVSDGGIAAEDASAVVGPVEAMRGDLYAGSLRSRMSWLRRRGRLRKPASR